MIGTWNLESVVLSKLCPVTNSNILLFFSFLYRKSILTGLCLIFYAPLFFLLVFYLLWCLYGFLMSPQSLIGQSKFNALWFLSCLKYFLAMHSYVINGMIRIICSTYIGSCTVVDWAWSHLFVVYRHVGGHFLQNTWLLLAGSPCKRSVDIFAY